MGPRFEGKRKRRKSVIVPGDGDPCPRCAEPMQIREYDQIGERPGHEFFTRWFCCLNKACKTTLVMPARYKVLLAVAEKKQANPEATITYVRKSNRRGDSRHPHEGLSDKN